MPWHEIKEVMLASRPFTASCWKTDEGIPIIIVYKKLPKSTTAYKTYEDIVLYKILRPNNKLSQSTHARGHQSTSQTFWNLK